MRSPGRSRNSMGTSIRRCCSPARRSIPRIGFEGIDLAYLGPIVMNEVNAGTHADLKDVSLRQRDDAPPNFIDRFRISQRAYEMRIDMVLVKRHTCPCLAFHPLAQHPLYRLR